MGTQCGRDSLWWLSTVGNRETRQNLSHPSQNLAAWHAVGQIVVLEVIMGTASNLADLSNAFLAGPSSLMEPAPLKRTSSGSVEPDWIASVVVIPSLGLGALARRAVPIATRHWDLV
jgi:hypothetical protein